MLALQRFSAYWGRTDLQPRCIVSFYEISVLNDGLVLTTEVKWLGSHILVDYKRPHQANCRDPFNNWQFRKHWKLCGALYLIAFSLSDKSSVALIPHHFPVFEVLMPKNPNLWLWTAGAPLHYMSKVVYCKSCRILILPSTCTCFDIRLCLMYPAAT